MLIKTNERSLFNVPFLTIFNFLFAYSFLCGILQSSLGFPVIGEMHEVMWHRGLQEFWSGDAWANMFSLPSVPHANEFKLVCVLKFSPSQDILTSVYFLNSLELKLSCLCLFSTKSLWEEMLYFLTPSQPKLNYKKVYNKKEVTP